MAGGTATCAQSDGASSTPSGELKSSIRVDVVSPDF